MKNNPPILPWFKVSSAQQSFYGLNNNNMIILLVMPITRRVRGMIRSQAYKARNLDKKVVRTFMGAKSEYSLESSPVSPPYNYRLFTGPRLDIVKKLHNIFHVSKYIDRNLLPCLHVVEDVSIFILKGVFFCVYFVFGRDASPRTSTTQCLSPYSSHSISPLWHLPSDQHPLETC
jgi:hypothetical protein